MRLTQEQRDIVLNTPGCLWDDDGNPAPDRTLGSELDDFTKKTGEEIHTVYAEFNRRKFLKPSGEFFKEYLYIWHFYAWSENYTLKIVNTMFGDQALEIVPKNPPAEATIKETIIVEEVLAGEDCC